VNKDFVLWRKEYREGYCVIENPEGVEKEHLLLKGVSMKDGWPKNVFCRMSIDYPKDIQLSDNLYGGNLVIISNRTKELLESLTASDKIEYLPVEIRNHKGRDASKDYFFMNPLNILDCIDQAKSGVIWNKIDKTRISSCKRLILKDPVIPPDCNIFRPKFMPKAILLRRDLATQLQSHGLTGLSFMDPADYGG
jgi:hypothetical protein